MTLAVRSMRKMANEMAQGMDPMLLEAMRASYAVPSAAYPQPSQQARLDPMFPAELQLEYLKNLPKADHPALTLGKTVAGLGIGTALGLGTKHLLSKATGGKIPSSVLSALIPMLGGALGMAGPMLHQSTVAKMREHSIRAHQEALLKAIVAHQARAQGGG